LETLWQILYRISEIIGNILAKSPEGIGNFCKEHICAIGLSMLSDPMKKFARGLPTTSGNWTQYL
jgi:hypothetical protein